MAKFKLSKGMLVTLGVLVVLVLFLLWAVQDWHQLWTISSRQTISIVAMHFLVPIFTWMGIRQSS